MCLGTFQARRLWAAEVDLAEALQIGEDELSLPVEHNAHVLGNMLPYGLRRSPSYRLERSPGSIPEGAIVGPASRIVGFTKLQPRRNSSSRIVV